MNTRISLAIGSAVLVFFGLSGCQKTEPETEGTAEKVGQKIDEATSKAAVHLNAIAERAGEGLAKAGEKLEQKAKEAQEKNEAQNDGATK